MGKNNCEKNRPKETKNISCHKECLESLPNICYKPIEYPCSRWSEFRPLNPKDEEIFFIALRCSCKSDFIPLLVSTQVYEGYNFIYLAEKINHCPCESSSLVYIQVCLMHCGKIKLVSIKDAHLYPDVSNECFPTHCINPCNESPCCDSCFNNFYKI